MMITTPGKVMNRIYTFTELRKQFCMYIYLFQLGFYN